MPATQSSSLRFQCQKARQIGGGIEKLPRRVAVDVLFFLPEEVRRVQRAREDSNL